MAGIQIRGLVKRYGKGASVVPVLHGIDASVQDGEFVVIVDADIVVTPWPSDHRATMAKVKF